MAYLDELHIDVSKTPGHGSDLFLDTFARAAVAPRARIISLRGFGAIRGTRIDALALACPSPGVEELWVDSDIAFEQQPVEMRLKVRLVGANGWGHFRVELPSRMLLPEKRYRIAAPGELSDEEELASLLLLTSDADLQFDAVRCSLTSRVEQHRERHA
jgi:hypothetical protein